MRSDILDHQDKYLATHDPKELEEVYIGLLKLLKSIARTNKEQRVELEDLMDIASTTAVRLMEKDKPVIKSSASAFALRSIYFCVHNKKRDEENHPHVLFSEIEYGVYEDPLKEDEYLEMERHDILVADILAHVEIPETLRPSVEHCLYASVPVAEVGRQITARTTRTEFYKKMKEVKAYVETHLQG